MPFIAEKFFSCKVGKKKTKTKRTLTSNDIQLARHFAFSRFKFTHKLHLVGSYTQKEGARKKKKVDEANICSFLYEQFATAKFQCSSIRSSIV